MGKTMNHVTNTEQAQIQRLIDHADVTEREEFLDQSKAYLDSVKPLWSTTIVPDEIMKQANTAIAMIVRVEATNLNKGSFFRTKRRLHYWRDHCYH